MKVTLAITIVVSSLAFIKGHPSELNSQQHNNSKHADVSKVYATNGRRLAEKMSGAEAEKMSMPSAAKSSKAKSVKSCKSCTKTLKEKQATGDAKAGKESVAKTSKAKFGMMSMPDSKSSKAYKTKSSKAKSVKSKMSRSAKSSIGRD